MADESDFSDSSDGDGEPREVSAEEAKRPAIYSTEGLHETLEDFGWSDQVDWLQTLAVTVDPKEEEPVDPENDLARELAFYTQALESAKEAYGRLTEKGVSILRPSDYYAEMVKTDDHMLKVKDKLLHEQKAIEEAEARRKQRENKKYGKEVQAAKLKERAQSKKRDIESVKKWRKQREQDSYEGGDDFQVSLDKDAEAPGPAPKKSPGSAVRSSRDARGPVHAPPSKKRVARDEKFGFGGRKKLKKQNDAMSSGDMDEYRGSFREGRGTRGGRGGRGGKGGKLQRPGKSKRAKQKSK